MISFKTFCYASGMPIPVEMTFSGENPYEVAFTFHQGLTQTTWLFDKCLLDELVETGTAGEGDVQFIDIDHNVNMRISSHEGVAIVEFDPCSIEEFLEQIEASPEMEYAGVSISDDEIYGWLDEA